MNENIITPPPRGIAPTHPARPLRHEEDKRRREQPANPSSRREQPSSTEQQLPAHGPGSHVDEYAGPRPER